MSRVIVGKNYNEQPIWKRYLGVPLVYLPILVTIPFVIMGAVIVRLHLKYIGCMEVKSYSDFVPSWVSHRYSYKNQITYSTETAKFHFRAFRWYWIFNCKLYCPMSVALFRYFAYLVMIVENWWCPFTHDKKSEYVDAAIDKSYWHIHADELHKLNPEDRDNPVWNEDAQKQD